MKNPKRRTEGGFTLIELMVTVAIVGLLSTVALPGFDKMAMRARETERTTHLTNLQKALVTQWRTEDFKLPSSVGCGQIPNVTGFTNVAFKQGIPAGSASDTCWNRILWGIDGGTKVRFTYFAGVQGTPRPNTAYFDITATADTNVNGRSSYITIHCVPGEATWCQGGGLSYTTYGGADAAELTPRVVNM